MMLGSCDSMLELGDAETSKDNLFSLMARPGGISVSFVELRTTLSDATPLAGFCPPGLGMSAVWGDSDTVATTDTAPLDISFDIDVVAVSFEAAGGTGGGGEGGDGLFLSDT